MTNPLMLQAVDEVARLLRAELATAREPPPLTLVYGRTNSPRPMGWVLDIPCMYVAYFTPNSARVWELHSGLLAWATATEERDDS